MFYLDFNMSQALISKRIKENQVEKKQKAPKWWAVELLGDTNLCKSQKYDKKQQPSAPR